MSATKYLIVGGGVAGATAAKQIRDLDEDAEVTILTDESEPLYNRIMLKTFMKGSLPLQYTRLHDKNWYNKRNINLELETRVIDVELEENKALTENNGSFEYDYLLVATGGSPRRLPQDPGNLDNLYYMWTMGDAERIKESAEDNDKAVVVGGGLLGIDLAVAYAENGCETDYLIRDDVWWSRGLEEKGAELIHDRLEEKGVNIVTNSEVSELEIEDDNIVEIVDNNGNIFDCDVLGVAIGQTPNSGFIDVEKNEIGMIKTDKFLQTSEETVFAAGNMIEYNSPVFDERTVKGSWDHSEEMGEAAGNNMVKQDKDEELEAFDYINTYGVGHFDVQFLAIGDWTGEDTVEKRYSDSEYRRLFFKDNRLVGCVMIGYTKGQEKVKTLIRSKEEFDNREKLLDTEFWE